MKVALLLSGLPRKVVEGYELTWKPIIEKYNADVYLQYWKDDEWKKVSETYTMAKSLHLQEPFKFTHFKEGISLPHNDTSRPLPQYDVMSCFRQLPMMYSWQTVYRNVYDTNIEYDYIIRSRYDLKLFQPIELNSLDGNMLNHSPRSGNFYDDNLCISNKKNSDIVFRNVFDDLLRMARERGALDSAESSWTDLVNLSGLEAYVAPQLKFDLLRENLVWWGDSEGNVISDRKSITEGMRDRPKL